MHLLTLLLTATSAATALSLPSLSPNRLTSQEAASNLNSDSTEDTASSSLSSILSDKLRLDRRQYHYVRPNATIKVCTAPHFAGTCYDATWPINTCIDLKGYSGITQSFSVQDGFQCLVMQAKCDGSNGYIMIGDSGEEKTVGEDLTNLSWIKNSGSYMCFEELQDLQRFVARFKAPRLPTSG